MQKEIWKDIPGYKGDYKVSNFGRVISFKHNKEYGKILSCRINNTGYRRVSLSLFGNTKQKTVHGLVSEAFLGLLPDGTMNVVINHIDGNILNNRLDNLELTNNRDNTSKGRVHTARKNKLPLGVHWRADANKYRSTIRIGTKTISLGYFDTQEEASEAYQKALTQL